MKMTLILQVLNINNYCGSGNFCKIDFPHTCKTKGFNYKTQTIFTKLVEL